jgi:hypothetical protein
LKPPVPGELDCEIRKKALSRERQTGPNRQSRGVSPLASQKERVVPFALENEKKSRSSGRNVKTFDALNLQKGADPTGRLFCSVLKISYSVCVRRS